jgi:hypothetical protein
MSFDVVALFAGLAVSCAGYALWRYGRNQTRPPQTVVGLLLMVFPCFASGTVPILGIGAALLLSLAVSLRLGL